MMTLKMRVGLATPVMRATMSNLKEWVEDRQENGDDGTGFDESISWSELAELTHATQVERFGFCTCEDLDPHEYPYADCVREIA
jgi:hypothetical protein